MTERLTEFIEKQDKARAATLCLNALEQGKFSLSELYENVLAPVLNRIIVTHSNEDDMIWREHMMSSIVRSIVEACYPYVLREREKMGLITDETVLVICPKQEEHEIGARMIADFFTIWGYNTVYIGANTPDNTLLKAVEALQPSFIAVSISNYYHMFAAKEMITNVKARVEVTVVAGGQAFAKNPEAAAVIGADRLLKSFEDIGRLRKGGDAQ